MTPASTSLSDLFENSEREQSLAQNPGEWLTPYAQIPKIVMARLDRAIHVFLLSWFVETALLHTYPAHYARDGLA
jgi:hypothetical protein